jgi:hypothetical protein
MSTVKSVPAGAQPPAAVPHRSWVARHKFLTTLFVLFILVAVGGYIFGWPLVKWRFHRLLIDSLAEIQQSPEVKEKLGEPISLPWSPMPSGRVDVADDGKRGDAQFYFTVVGPKGTADAESTMRMLDGKWGYTRLILKFANQPPFDLTQAIQQRDGDEMPKFDPNAKQVEMKPPDLNVDVSIPQDLPAEPKK